MTKRTLATGAALLLTFGLAACGGGEPAPEAEAPEAAPPAAAPPPAAGGMPSWFQVEGNNVTMDIVAGATPDANHWNFNGATNGAMTITVPEGAQVTINFRNADPAMAHSLGISAFTATPAAAPAAEPAFPGAISADPTSMTASTLTGESETIMFTASTAGEYVLTCYIPGHAISGMWVRFNVGGEAGVTGAPNVQLPM